MTWLYRFRTEIIIPLSAQKVFRFEQNLMLWSQCLGTKNAELSGLLYIVIRPLIIPYKIC